MLKVPFKKISFFRIYNNSAVIPQPEILKTENNGTTAIDNEGNIYR